MGLMLVGTIEYEADEIIGYRLMRLNSEEVGDVPLNRVIQLLKTTDTKIKGLRVEGGKLVGTNGSISRYPVIGKSGIRGKSPLIILSQYIKEGMTVGFKVCDYKGKIIDVSIESAIEYAEQNGIANGAIKSLGDKKIISSIVGTYDKIDLGKGSITVGVGKKQRYGSEFDDIE